MLIGSVQKTMSLIISESCLIVQEIKSLDRKKASSYFVKGCIIMRKEKQQRRDISIE